MQPITRRRLLQYGLGTGAALTLPWTSRIPWASAAGGKRRTSILSSRSRLAPNACASSSRIPGQSASASGRTSACAALRAAIEADIDILAHPGLITLEEAALARERGIFLELSARKGHCLANGHVARMALEVGASLIVDTDSHSPSDLITRQQAERIAKGAGLRSASVQTLLADAEALARRLAEL